MANEADGQIVLFLGRYGILHLCRSPSIDEVNSAAERGVIVKVLAQLDRRTLKFFEQLHDSIEIRHSDEVNSLGVLKDQSDVIQFLFVEQNPVGRGREDAALVVSSEVFASSHYEFMMAIWNRAVDFNSAKKRFTEERIVDPLRLTIGEGSFLEQFEKHWISAANCLTKTHRSIQILSSPQAVKSIKRERRYKMAQFSVFSNLALISRLC